MSPETRFVDLPGRFSLGRGGTLPGIRVAYRTWGEPSPEAVLVCHALTGSADADDWWEGLFGQGKALDPSRDFIVAANVLGSCYGTTGPASIDPGTGRAYGPDFPEITIEDMVRVQAALLHRLGVDRIRLVVGGSMGAMQALAWGAAYPQQVGAIVPIASGASQSAWALALHTAQRAAIEGDPRFRGGRYQPAFGPDTGLAVARMIAMSSYRSPQSFDERFGRGHDGETFAVESYLRYQGRKLVDRFDANSYLTLIRAMDRFDIRASLATVTAPALVIGISSDVLYPASEVRDLARSLPNAEYATLHAPHGHDAFLIETDAVNRLIVGFRERLAAGRTPRRDSRPLGVAWA